MQVRALGPTGLRISRLGLGTMTWGQQTDEHEGKELLTSFVEAGGNFLDTAAGYGGGAAEAQIGRLLGTVVARDDLILATKAGLGRGPHGRSLDTSRRALLDTLDASLSRLGTDHVDLWQVHVWSDDTPVEETLSALDHAVTVGKARYVGISNYSGWQTAQAATWQRAFPGRALLASTQVEYSLLNRQIEDEIIPAAAAAGMSILPWSPLGRGVLTAKYRSGTPADSRAASDHSARFISTYLDDRSASIVESVVRAADGLGWTPLQVALVWVRDRPGVAAPIIGPRLVSQLAPALGCESLTLPPEIAEALDDVSGD